MVYYTWLHININYSVRRPLLRHWIWWMLFITMFLWSSQPLYWKLKFCKFFSYIKFIVIKYNKLGACYLIQTSHYLIQCWLVMCKDSQELYRYNFSEEYSLVYLNTVDCHFNAVHFITILHTAMWWQCQNINQTLDSQKTPHTLPSRASCVSILEKIDRVITASHYNIFWYHFCVNCVTFFTSQRVNQQKMFLILYYQY